MTQDPHFSNEVPKPSHLAGQVLMALVAVTILWGVIEMIRVMA